MSEYIYSRVSTEQQSADPQILRLATLYPKAQIICEVASGAKHRPMLQALVNQLQKGDVLIVVALDRLGRRTSEVLLLIEALEKKGVILKSLREGVDYSTPVGKLVTQILVSVAEMERNMISERTKAGLMAARAKGRLGGRKPYLAPGLKEQAVLLATKDGLPLKTIAQMTGLSVSYISKLCRRQSGVAVQTATPGS